ncbi:MAG TPA: ADP-ribosylglycohydrolase family protein [Acidobacteriota bacterium]|nr:ADP-ribosylglycohydrolase family protein [Acidobacteriota bacterium]HRR55511.1 ADP-ribosylglycohydrolase family protein [Acidobacteriota bacterium]HRV07086.1 ADP-ribosylglycohydrolase family protein [Acidobacteriota bacterium]
MLLRRVVSWAMVLAAVGVGWACRQERPPGMRSLTLDELEDKVRGGWAGQMIGVSYGAPTEFRYQGRIIPMDEVPSWSSESLKNAIHQDDLYVEMTLAEVLDDVGLDATTEDFGMKFRESKYPLWHANLAARRSLRRGVPASVSGTPAYNIHANDIDFQIESDFIGLMSPGLPQFSNDLCLRVGRVMNYGDGILGGVFVASMYSAAFFEHDMRRIVEAGLANLPPASPYAQVIRDVLQWHTEHPDDWQRVWRFIGDKWDKGDPCPDGALTPFNIDAKLNGSYIALGLLYGAGDFARTLEIATRAGQDSDCNPSNAAGILGVVLGFSGIPDEWKEGLTEISREKFSFTRYSLEDIVGSTVKRAVEAVERTGGYREGDEVWVKIQDPIHVDLPLWTDYGVPEERVGVGEDRWRWKGRWQLLREDERSRRVVGRRAEAAGASAEIEFEGSGAIVVGNLLPDGGKADIYLDGSLVATVDVNSDEDSPKRDAVWFQLGLPLAQHTLRLEVRGEPYGDSQGTAVEITDLVVFR